MKITLPELPKKARVYVDGALVELPLRVPRSTDRIKIVVRAKGYHSHEDKVVPDRDRELEFKMWRRKR